MLHVLAHFDNVAAELVPQHHRIIHRPGVIGRPLVKIRPTDPDVGHLQEDIGGADDGFSDLTDLHRAFLGAKLTTAGAFMKCSDLGLLRTLANWTRGPPGSSRQSLCEMRHR